MTFNKAKHCLYLGHDWPQLSTYLMFMSLDIFPVEWHLFRHSHWDSVVSVQYYCITTVILELHYDHLHCQGRTYWCEQIITQFDIPPYKPVNKIGLPPSCLLFQLKLVFRTNFSNILPLWYLIALCPNIITSQIWL